MRSSESLSILNWWSHGERSSFASNDLYSPHLDSTAFIQNTVMATLNLLEQYDITGLYAGGSTLPGSLRIEAIASEATSSSARHILTELETAINGTADLLSALTRFEEDGRTQRQCAKPVLAKTESCADIAQLFRDLTSAQSVLVLLTTLKAILEHSTNETWRRQTSGASGCNLAVSHALTKVHVEALDAMTMGITETRQAIQAEYTGA